MSGNVRSPGQTGTAGCLWRGTLRALSVMAGRHGEEGVRVPGGAVWRALWDGFLPKASALTKGSRTLSSGSNVHLGI